MLKASQLINPNLRDRQKRWRLLRRTQFIRQGEYGGTKPFPKLQFIEAKSECEEIAWLETVSAAIAHRWAKALQAEIVDLDERELDVLAAASGKRWPVERHQKPEPRCRLSASGGILKAGRALRTRYALRKRKKSVSWDVPKNGGLTDKKWYKLRWQSIFAQRRLARLEAATEVQE